MSGWNIDFLIAVLLLNELFWGSRGKANSDAWLAGFALALLNTPRVLMWEIQQREEGGILFLCGTDMERANETHQRDRLILSQSTKQPFGFRHSGCSQGENKLQSRGILCNSPRDSSHTHGGICVSPFAAYGPSLVQLLGQALWSWNLHTTGTWRKGHPWERSELDLSGFSFKASGQAFWKVKCSPCSEIFIAENLPETIEIVISHI